MLLGLIDPVDGRKHIIDAWGETTYCTKFSAWGTANPYYTRAERSLYPVPKFVDLDKYESDARYCHICERRHQLVKKSRDLCRDCKAVFHTRIVFDADERANEPVCKYCGSSNKVTVDA